MPGARARAVLGAAMIAALVAISGCGGGGGDGGIPQDTADSMLELTERIRDANANQDCDTASEATTELRGQVDGLESGETKQALDAMVTQLDENIDVDCVPEGPSGEANAKPDEEEPTTSVPVEPETTAPTTTTTETTEPEPEEPPEPEQPPSEGGGPNGPPQTPPGQSGGGPPTGGIEE